MSNQYKYNEIVAKAKQIQENIKTKYKSDVHNRWGYYCSKAILNPKMNVTKMDIASAPKPAGDYISRQIKKDGIKNVCEFIVDFAEKNKRMPNFVRWNNKKIRVRDYINMTSYCLVFQSEHNRIPNYYNINSKAFTKPTEYPNEVYALWVKTFGFAPKYIDEVCDYIRDHFTYQFYFDDQKSNAEVIKSKSGNCTDLSQMASNVAEAMGYEVRAIHTQCRISGTGHIYTQFRKEGINNGEWFTRDLSCIADESRYCVWCDVNEGAGYLLAVNPEWWVQNRNR